eukprot:jgi/Mesen1/1921/ME000144S01044
MVKKKSARQKITDKNVKQSTEATKAKGDDYDDGVRRLAGSINGESGRIKRKVTKSLRFLDKLRQTHDALAATKTLGKKKQKRKRLSGQTLESLQTLSEFLPNIAQHEKAKLLATGAHKGQRAPKVYRAKHMKGLMAQEAQQLAAVRSHPVFQSNPFAAIRQHLQNTLPPAPARLQPKKSEAGKKEAGKGCADDGIEVA